MTTPDWTGVRAALDRARKQLAAADLAAADARSDENVLKERARRLAEPLTAHEAPTDVLHLLAFSRGGGDYGVLVSAIAGVVPLDGWTAVPSLPRAILGVINHRGRVLALADVAPLFGADGGDLQDPLAVVVEFDGGSFALVADGVSGTTVVRRAELVSGPGAQRESAAAPVLATTRDLVVVLDVEALARDPRVEVEDDGE